GGQLGVGKAVKSAVDGSGRPVDTPTAGQLPSLVSYCLNRRTNYLVARLQQVHLRLDNVTAKAFQDGWQELYREDTFFGLGNRAGNYIEVSPRTPTGLICRHSSSSFA
ncbi:MAG: hypothetical protein ABSF46_31705, partial [Terriglobia bacterium]